MKKTSAFFGFGLSMLLLASCAHPDNDGPEYIIKNDNYAKMGQFGGYNVNHESFNEESNAAPVATDTSKVNVAPAAHGAESHGAGH